MNKFFQKAAHQRDCHRQQVSGAWNIDAKEFCKEAGVDYDKALEYQIQHEMEERDDAIDEQLARFEEALGSLTEKQIDHFRDNNTYKLNDDGYSYYFWYYVTKQLVAR